MMLDPWLDVALLSRSIAAATIARTGIDLQS